MSIDNANLVAYVSKQSYNPILLDETITEITLLVLKRHFSQCLSDDEMLSLGRFKALMLLSASHASAQKNLVNFLFTGVRNEIGNLLRKEKKVDDLMERFSEAIKFSFSANPHFEDELHMQEEIKIQSQKIFNNLKQLGIDLESNLGEFLIDYKEEALQEYTEFVLRASIMRTLLHG